MPIYDFKCGECGTVSEILLLDGDTAKAVCPDCGSKHMEKLISAFNTVNRGANPPGTTCCGRDERCDKPPCSQGESCYKG